MEKQLTLFKVRDLREKTQYKIDDIYLDKYARVCGMMATVVYNSLCRHAEFHSQIAFPSQELIAYQHGISVSSVKRAIRKLVSYRIIAVGQERSKGKFNRNVYTLLDKDSWKPPKPVPKFTMGHPRSTVEPGVTEPGVTGEPLRKTKKNKENKEKISFSKKGTEVLSQNRENKERGGKPSPAEEMRLFLEGKDFALKVAELISRESRIPLERVVSELNNFKGYWTERNKSGTKQRWEIERTFELKRRLGTWFRNLEKFDTSKKKNIIV